MLERGDVADGGEHRDVLEAYRMFANDHGWSHRLHEAVATGLTAEAAVERVQSDTRARMLRSTDPYLRDRLHDLEDLGHRLMRQLVGQDHAPSANNCRTMPFSSRARWDLRRCSTMIAESGCAVWCWREKGPTSPTSRSWRARSASQPFAELPDTAGYRRPWRCHHRRRHLGEIYIRPSAEMKSAYAEPVATEPRRQAQYSALRDKPCVTKDGQPIELMINAGLTIDLPHIDDTGSAGIGLFRTELQFMVGQSLPRASDQLALYRAVLDAAGPKPVTSAPWTWVVTRPCLIWRP